MTKLKIGLGIVFTAMGVQAAMIAGWDVNGIDVADGTGLDAPGAPYTCSATTGETAYVTAQLTLGGGVNPSTSASKYGFKIPSADATTSLSEAIASDHYLEFTLTISNGYALILESIEMNGGGSSTACSNVVLMFSTAGFTNGLEIASAYPANGTGGFDTDASGFGAPIDLSNEQYSNLTGSISFRLYGWNHTSGAAVTALRNLSGDDLVVNGTVVEHQSGVGPTLSLISSNGTSSIAAVFDGANSTDYILQHSVNLTDSNAWQTVSTPFDANVDWQIMTTNSAGFYRAIAE